MSVSVTLRTMCLQYIPDGKHLLRNLPQEWPVFGTIYARRLPNPHQKYGIINQIPFQWSLSEKEGHGRGIQEQKNKKIRACRSNLLQLVASRPDAP